MQVVRLTVTETRESDITVTVPDGFDVNLLRQSVWLPAVQYAIDALEPNFQDSPEADYGVETVEKLEGAAAEQELKDYESFNLSEPIAERQKLLAKWQAEAQAAKVAKAATVNTNPAPAESH